MLKQRCRTLNKHRRQDMLSNKCRCKLKDQLLNWGSGKVSELSLSLPRGLSHAPAESSSSTLQQKHQLCRKHPQFSSSGFTQININQILANYQRSTKHSSVTLSTGKSNRFRTPRASYIEIISYGIKMFTERNTQNHKDK